MIYQFRFGIIMLGVFFQSLACFAQTPLVDSLLSSLKTLPNDTNRVKALGRLSQQLRDNDPYNALKYADEAIRLSEKLKWEKGIANSCNRAGIIHSNMGNYELALTYYLKSLRINEKLNNQRGIGDLYNNIGKMYWSLGDYAKAMQYQFLALKVYQTIRDVEGQASSYLNMGTIHGNLGEYRQALYSFQKALKIAEMHRNDKTIAILYNNLGDVYANMKKYKLALDYAAKALSLAEKLNAKNLISIFNLSIGEIYLKEGTNLKRAEGYLLESLVLAKSINNKELIENCNLFLAQLYAGKNDFKKAYSYRLAYEQVKDSINSERVNKRLSELDAAYKNEKIEQQMALVLKENEIQELRLERNNYLISALIIICALIIFIGVLFIQKIKLKSRQHALLLEQKALRAQINPHFLFNALNAIQKFIANGDKANAHGFIGKFSHLMRSILDNSDKTFIPIEDELKAVRLYLEIEQLRLKHGFDFEITVDDAIDMQNTYMPAMILQPYVENAIWHGLVHSRKKGVLTINLTKENRLISFVITDNGVGRDATVKDQGKPDKPSGMSLVLDRLNVINSISGSNLKVEIHDLKTDKGTAAGTRVLIRMLMNG